MEGRASSDTGVRPGNRHVDREGRTVQEDEGPARRPRDVPRSGCLTLGAAPQPLVRTERPRRAVYETRTYGSVGGRGRQAPSDPIDDSRPGDLNGYPFTWLSKTGAAPRTAQALARHTSIDLTMRTYTDPMLLDKTGAIERLPDLTTRAAEIWTGTDDRPVSDTARPVVLPVVMTGDFSCPHVSSSVTTEGTTADTQASRKPLKTLAKVNIRHDVSSSDAIGATGFEPAASWSRTKRSSQAELRPASCGDHSGFTSVTSHPDPSARKGNNNRSAHCGLPPANANTPRLRPGFNRPGPASQLT